jgi:hypothetical protein
MAVSRLTVSDTPGHAWPAIVPRRILEPRSNGGMTRCGICTREGPSSRSIPRPG